MEDIEDYSEASKLINDDTEQLVYHNSFEYLQIENLSNKALERLKKVLLLLGAKLEQNSCFIQNFGLNKLLYSQSDRLNDFQNFSFLTSNWQVTYLDNDSNVENDINSIQYNLQKDINTNPFCMVNYDDKDKKFKLCIYSSISQICRFLDEIRSEVDIGKPFNTQLKQNRKQFCEFLPFECTKLYEQLYPQEVLLTEQYDFSQINNKNTNLERDCTKLIHDYQYEEEFEQEQDTKIGGQEILVEDVSYGIFDIENQQ